MSTAHRRAEVFAALTAHVQRALSVFASKEGSVSEAVASAIGGALKADATRTARLGPTGDLGMAAAAGTWPHEKWIGFAQAQWDDVNAQLRYLGAAEGTWQRFWNEVVVESAKDLGAAAEAAIPTKGTVFAGLGLVVTGLIALAVIMVMK